MENLQEKIEALMSQSKYNEAGELFLKETGTKMKVEFLKSGSHFDFDKDERDIYKITFIKNSREYSFDFGQSLNDSGFYFMIGKKRYDIDRQYLDSKNLQSIAKRISWDFDPRRDKIHKPIPPNAYSILACLTKYDPGTFEDFCDEFGYDTDSRSAKKTYNAVFNEWINLQRIFSNEELYAMSEIA